MRDMTTDQIAQTEKINRAILHAVYSLRHASTLPHMDSYKVAQAEATLVNSMIAR